MDARAFRLVPAAGAAWVAAAAGIFVPSAAVAVAGGCGALAGVGVALLLLVRRSPHRNAERVGAVVAVMIVALAFAGTAAATAAFAAPARTAAVEGAAGRALDVTALLTGKPERTAVGWRADALAVSISAGVHALPGGVPVTLLFDDRPTALDVGARVRADATAFAADPGERAVLIVRVRDDTAQVEPPGGALAVVADLRASLGRESAGLPSPGAGLIPGLAVGDTSRVGDDLDSDMKASSLSHLTAVSGANCAIVVGLAFVLAAACRLSRGARVTAGLVALGGFVLLVTPEPSVVRAATMSAVAMLAVLLGRRGTGIAVLSLSVAVLLALDPWLASSLGFALSVVATGALLVLAPPLARGLGRHLPGPIAAMVAVPLSAQLVCGPLIVLITPGVSLYGVAANLLAAPAAPVATIVGLAACAAAPLPWLHVGLTTLAWLPAAWIAAVARLISGLPGAVLPWHEGLPGLVALAIAGAAVALVVWTPGRGRWARVGRGLSAVGLLIGAGVIAGTVVVSAVIVPLRTPQDWRIAMCDIGQGDALLLRAGGQTMLVDTGPNPESLASCLDRLGIGRLDVVVLTHFDLDHVGGAAAVAGRAGVLVHGPVADEQDERTLDRIAAERRVEAVSGVYGTLGDATWRVLWPGSPAFPPGNDASVVIDIAGAGMPRTLLLGDLGADAQRALLVSGVLRPPYRVVKLSHHGSADQELALYRALAADLAVISVGVDNDYGHPRDEALRMLQNLGVRIARTDEDGLVLVGTASAAGDGPPALTVWRDRAPPDVGRAE